MHRRVSMSVATRVPVIRTTSRPRARPTVSSMEAQKPAFPTQFRPSLTRLGAASLQPRSTSASSCTDAMAASVGSPA